MKLFSLTAGALISPRWLAQLLVCGSQLVTRSDEAPRVLEGTRPPTHQSAGLRGSVPAACVPERDGRDALIRGALCSDQHPSSEPQTACDSDYTFHLQQACHLVHLFIFLFSGPTSTDNASVNFLKAFCVMTGLSSAGLGVSLLCQYLSLRQFEKGPRLGPAGGLDQRRHHDLRGRKRGAGCGRPKSKPEGQAKGLPQAEILNPTLGKGEQQPKRGLWVVVHSRDCPQQCLLSKHLTRTSLVPEPVLCAPPNSLWGRLYHPGARSRSPRYHVQGPRWELSLPDSTAQT